MAQPLTPDDVEAAARALRAVAHHTPVHTSRHLDTLCGAAVFLKCENLQRAGAFKFRGAYTAMSRLDPRARDRGVVSYSSGNHAQAVALAARVLGTTATIVMPTDAPQAKLDATRDYGATVVLYDRYTQDRVEIARELAERDDATVIPPFDHADVIAGQGSVAWEFITDTSDLDVLLVPLGGGGLLSGTLLAARAVAPDMEVYGVEPSGAADGLQSLRAGHIVTIDQPHTVADGAATRRLGSLTFPIIADGVTDILTVDDAQLIDAMRFLATRCKLVIEPTAALGVAATISHRDRFRGRRVGVIVSGGNVDLARFTAPS